MASINNSVTDSTQREKWIDVAKVLTMILVIIGHSTYYSIHTAYGGTNPFAAIPLSNSLTYKLILIISGFIYSFHMPFFIAVSGMTLAISYKPQAPMKEISKKRAKRLLIPFITVTIFLSIPLKYISGYWDASENIMRDIFCGQILLLGNSHLWYVVSLFYITIVFIWLLRHNFNHGWIFWTVCIIATFIGNRLGITRLGECFGITGFLRFFLYFSLGYYLWEHIKTFSVKATYIFPSWIAMIVAFITAAHFAQATPPIIRLLYSPIMAIWGCVNMIATAKEVAKWSVFVDHPITQAMNTHCYKLYLYSDPFNYVLITILVAVFGSTVITADASAAISFLVRIFGSLGLAFALVYFMNGLSRLSKRLNFKKTI